MHSNLSGSSWNKWDLHVHTPDSIVHGYSGPDAWGRYIDELSKLPPEFKVLGINDYIFLDGYKKVLAAKEEGRLPNIELLLPVIELRLNKFGGSKNSLSRVNYHVIFSDEISTETIESQFLATLRSDYILTPTINALAKSGKWTGVPTKQSLHDLGEAIIETVPADEKKYYASPIEEGFNNLCCSLDDIEKALESPYFKGRFLTAVGKTEWADIKWNGQSIAEKKHIINGADFVFISAESVEAWRNAKDSLSSAGVNDLLLDCSDAHRYADSDDKDRLGKCSTWVKGDLCFETLRQARFEPGSRLCISEHRPLEPLLKIGKVAFDFPSHAELRSNDSTSLFCFRGKHEFFFSPYLTCIIGGRGSGKSTLLNLIHEKVRPGKNHFFKTNRVINTQGKKVNECINMDDADASYGGVEFIQQNEIEQLAHHPERFTNAIFQRLRKLDTEDELKADREKVISAIQSNGIQQRLLNEYYDLLSDLVEAEKELVTNRKLIESFENEEFKAIQKELGDMVKQIQVLKSGKSRMSRFYIGIQAILEKTEDELKEKDTIYDEATQRAVDCIKEANEAMRTSPKKLEGDKKIEALEEAEGELRARIDRFLDDRGLSQENLQDVGKATKQIAELEELIETMRKTITQTKEQIGQFEFTLKPTEDYKASVLKHLNPINAVLAELGSQVKPIKLEYTFDSKSADEAAIAYIAKIISDEAGTTIRVDYLRNILEHINLIEIESHEKFLQAIQPDNKTSKAVYDYLSNEKNFYDMLQMIRIEHLRVEDYQRIYVYYDGKPIESTSFGQRCTAAIVVLLLVGNTPIIIDEPEAHLDSSLIARYLVDLVKQKKQERQIIFATHNANFVINGDAELVHILRDSGDGTTAADSTTIENLQHRQRLLALEGGHDAFKQREHRYGI
ncbi:AAA family ATPase [Coraliomargarita sp. SDUM461003]|uniref:AAA family ATPase n=1 Tax=Thalassobacterium maritimum TaxID=3041265 RepID=A0ABU1AWM0_9BACT|nr:AAA family ATPase [Coraliomargarita sp. SDUM461003]MDQ8207382.1 AAA family ATPase [Coraliomargarita sp. SDUM461003]